MSTLIAGTFTVYFVCGTIGIWVLGTIVYFGLASL
jgi:hypothetical protein